MILSDVSRNKKEEQYRQTFCSAKEGKGTRKGKKAKILDQNGRDREMFSETDRFEGDSRGDFASVIRWEPRVSSRKKKGEGGQLYLVVESELANRQ